MTAATDYILAMTGDERLSALVKLSLDHPRIWGELRDDCDRQREIRARRAAAGPPDEGESPA